MIDEDVHVVVDRDASGITTRRLHSAERERVLRALDDLHYDLAAKLLGPRRSPR